MPSNSVIQGHSGNVSSVCFNSHGTIIASGSWDGTSRLWNTSTRKQLSCLTSNDADCVTSVAFSADDNYIAAASSNIVTLWDVETSQQLALLHHPHDVSSVSFSADGRMLATGTEGGSIHVWDTALGRRLVILAGHAKAVKAVWFCHSGTIVSGSADMTIRLWDVGTGETTHVLSGHEGYVTSVCEQRGTVVSGSFDRTVRLWRHGKTDAVMRGHTDCVRCVCFSSDSTIVLSGSDDCSVRVWDVDTCKQLSVYYDHVAPIHSVCLSNDGHMAVSGSRDAALHTWCPTQLQKHVPQRRRLPALTSRPLIKDSDSNLPLSRSRTQLRASGKAKTMPSKNQKARHLKARGQEEQEHGAGQCHQEQAIVHMSLPGLAASLQDMQSQISTLTSAHVNMQHALQRLEQGQHEVTTLIRTLLNLPSNPLKIPTEAHIY